jgi:predicted N-acetyltransferase YhbS
LKRQYRPAVPEELDQIYTMGYDAWSDGKSFEEYLQGCKNSPKYKAGQWFVLCVEGIPVSSVLIHTLQSWGHLQIRGIGSLATTPELRNRGYGRQLVNCVTTDLSTREDAYIFLLYSDIDPAFYEALGFVQLPQKYQKVQKSILMAKMPLLAEESIFEKYLEKIPGYF